VAYAIQPGDHVDIIASLLYVEVDEDFQSRLPNNVSFIGFIESEGNLNMGFGSAMDGRIETERLPYTRFDITTVSAQQVPIEWPVMVNPYEPPRPRLTTQRTVTDALVMHIGNFPLDGVLFPTPTPEATHEVAPVVEEAPPQQQANVPATAVPTEVPMPDIVTLAVSPQQAVTLTYMIESHIPLTFVLRAANDLSQTPTSQVTLRYIMEQYEIVVPTKEEFAIEPAIRSIRQTFAGDTISLSEE